MSALAVVTILAGGVFFLVGFVLLAKTRVESGKCLDMLNEVAAEKQYMRMLKEVGVGKGLIRCDGRDYIVTGISTDMRGSWSLQAEDAAELNRRLNYAGGDSDV